MAEKILLISGIVTAILTVLFFAVCIWKRKEIAKNLSKARKVGTVILSIILIIATTANFVGLQFTNLINQYFTS